MDAYEIPREHCLQIKQTVTSVINLPNKDLVTKNIAAKAGITII